MHSVNVAAACKSLKGQQGQVRGHGGEVLDGLLVDLCWRAYVILRDNVEKRLSVWKCTVFLCVK